MHQLSHEISTRSVYFFLFSSEHHSRTDVTTWRFCETFTLQFHLIYCNWIDCTETLIGTFRTENALMHRKIMIFFRYKFDLVVNFIRHIFPILCIEPFFLTDEYSTAWQMCRNNFGIGHFQL